MNRIALAACAAVLALTLAQPALAAGPSALEAALAAQAAKHHGKVGLFAVNLKTGETAVLDPDAPAPTASTIKLTALLEALAEIDQGKARLDEPVILTKDNQVQGSGMLGLIDPPKILTLKDALTLMIALSDNTATNLVIDRFGLAAINARSASIGLTQTVFYKKVFKPIEGPIPPEQPRFGLGKTTPREMAEVMRRIVRCELGAPGSTPTPAGRAACDAALSMLRDQFYRAGIPRYLESLDSTEAGSAIAEKTGAVDEARSDVAAIATKNGTLILAIYTYENKDHGWTADDEGDLTIARLAKLVVSAWAPRGPDASAGF
jgi:beta-lactamase class A